jgi:hypothetical protein
MAMRLVTVATFPSPIEAALARNILAEAGIRAEATEGASALAWTGMIGHVKLLVDESELERARDLLDEAFSHPLQGDDDPDEQDEYETNDIALGDYAENLADRSPPEGQPAWTCPVCGVRVGEEERRCWSCGASAAGEPNPYFIRGDSTQGSRPREPLPDHIVPDDLADTVNRAWLAALLGLPLLPLAHLYSAWLLWSVAEYAGHLQGKTRRRFYVAFALDVLVVGLLIMLIVSMMRG